MPVFKRRRPIRKEDPHHRVRVVTFEDEEDPAFVAICSCGKVSPPLPTEADAYRWGREHGAAVEGDLEVLTGEGGVGWQCMFCGAVIDNAPLRVSVSWTDDGGDGEQWYAAHRTCLTERMSSDGQFAPRFDAPSDEAG